MVRLDENADVQPPIVFRKSTGRGSDPTLEAVADHPGAAADGSFPDPAARWRASIAASTCSARTWKLLTSLRTPSHVSPTTGQVPGGLSLRDGMPRRALRGTTPTECVFGECDRRRQARPDSRTQCSPVSSPFPFRRWAPAKTGSAPGSPSCGNDDGDSRAHVVALDQRGVADACALTSVIAFAGPGSPAPTRCRGRGRARVRRRRRAGRRGSPSASRGRSRGAGSRSCPRRSG